MQTCPSCRKSIPTRDRFCAYCGTRLPRALPWLGWRPAQARAAGARPPGWPANLPSPGGWLVRSRFGAMAAGGALLGTAIGGILGQAFGNVLLGALVGGGGVAAAAFVGEGAAGLLPDRRSAERFGLALGGLGGITALPAGLIVVAAVVWLAAGWAGLSGFAAQVRADPNQGLLGPFAGALVGTVTGALAGYYLGLTGYGLGRRGAILGAALAWTLAAVLAGLVTADQAAQTEAAAGVARGEAAALGILLSVGGGAVLLALARRWLGRLRRWWAGRP